MTYLRNLSMTFDSEDGFTLVHSSPAMPDRWTYVLQPGEAIEAFQAMHLPLAFIGHTHFPAVHMEEGFIRPFLPSEPVRSDAKQKILVNVGSVGQPRDGDSRAAYVIYDGAERSVALRKLLESKDAAVRAALG